jgi:hypothetical protein
LANAHTTRSDSPSVDPNCNIGAERMTSADVSNLNKCLGAKMPGSPVPIYLGCAGLIVGSLGLGAQHLLGGNSVSSTSSTPEQPLFARSVEQASLPMERWSSQNRDVAYYGPMVELLTTPTSSTPAPAMEPSPTAAQQEQQPAAAEEPRAAPREVVRDLPQQQTNQSRRTRNQRSKDDARARNEATVSTEQADPRDVRAQDRQQTGPRRSERRYRDREEAEPTDTRFRSERRQRDGERRVAIREETREPEQRVVRGPEQREGFGFSPFRLFGIFDR